MPKSLLFVPCETYHVDADTNQHTPGKILQDVALWVFRGQRQPIGTLQHPKHHPSQYYGEWQVVALFENSSEDQGKKFNVDLDLKFPDGSVVDLGTDVFKAHKTFHWYNSTQKDVPQTPSFNRITSGDYHLRMWVQEEGKSRHAMPTGNFPFTVRFVTYGG